jgi:hypothetical protein
MNCQLSENTLILSQDYELFFHRSGSVENCLLRPSRALAEFARKRDFRITFYVDAGMLVCMRKYAPRFSAVNAMRDQVCSNIESLASEGHEIGLHVHPHWHATRWTDNGWDFSNTRYSPRQFRRREFVEICSAYANELSSVADTALTTYRAGGFCIQPFERIGEALRGLGIQTDSSVVPGMYLNDQDKSFDFRKVPDTPWWFFDDEPTNSVTSGRFLEVPVTSMRLSPFYYWGRAVDRLLKRQPPSVYGDGLSKGMGSISALRRLLALERRVEMSTDGPKALQLNSASRVGTAYRLHHVMGHPKLLSKLSLEQLAQYIDRHQISRFETVASLSREVRRGMSF